jgi:hypothetical protein
MANAQKLYIYDKSSEIDRKQASGRFDDDDDVLTIGVQLGLPNLIKVFENLANNNMTFNRLLFQTHGSPGGIWFGNDFVSKHTLKPVFASFASLFPHPARIYFDGCNVAEGGDGTDFLLAAGETLLALGGGDAFGFTTIGHGVSGWVPFIGGHTLHFGDSSTFKRIRFFPGGEPDFPDSWIP